MSHFALWGHHVDDYKEMFDLSEDNFLGKLLEYGSGPSAFNAELTQANKQCISCDPLFTLDRAKLMSATAIAFDNSVKEIEKNQVNFNFNAYGNLEGLIQNRRLGTTCFFNDYVRGKKEKRYLAIHDVILPFADFSFDLALSSHYLFSERDNQDIDFQVKIIKELARVAKEVRIFPLIDPNNQPSPFLGPVLLQLQQDNYGIEVRSVPYHLQQNDSAMLRVWAYQCLLT